MKIAKKGGDKELNKKAKLLSTIKPHIFREIFKYI
jgi:hypothetical protein